MLINKLLTINKYKKWESDIDQDMWTRNSGF